MNFEEFANLRLTIKYAGFTPHQLILLFGDLTGRLIDFEHFGPVQQQLSDTEELLVEALDAYEDAKPYQPDPADMVEA